MESCICWCYKSYLLLCFRSLVGRDSSVDTVTRYGLDGLGIESRWMGRGGGRDFPHPSRPVLGPTQPPIQWVPGLSPGVKRPGRGVDQPPASSAEVQDRARAIRLLPLCSRVKHLFTLYRSLKYFLPIPSLLILSIFVSFGNWAERPTPPSMLLKFVPTLTYKLTDW